MREKNIKDKKQKNNMKKTIMFSLILLLSSSGHALFGLFEKPVTVIDITQQHTIYDDINNTGQSYATTCSPINLQVPYKQLYYSY